jgi:predicted amidohydrolase YtcJ
VGEPDNFGTLYNDQDELNADMLLTAQGGMQASLHAIGDVAIEQALQGVEYCLTHGVDPSPLRFRFEHVESRPSVK